MSIDEPTQVGDLTTNDEADQIEKSNVEKEVNNEIESQQTISRNKPKNPDMEMEVGELIKSIGESLIFSAHCFQRKVTKKVNKKLNEIENSIGKNMNTPLLSDINEKIEVLQITLPMEDLEIFKAFDKEVSQNREKIDAVVGLFYFKVGFKK